MTPRLLLLFALLAAVLAACGNDDGTKATLSEPGAVTGPRDEAGGDGDDLAGPLPRRRPGDEGRAAGSSPGAGTGSQDAGVGGGAEDGRDPDRGNGRTDGSRPSGAGGSGSGSSGDSGGSDESAGPGGSRSLTAEQEAEFEAIRDRVRELVQRNNARDSSICTELMTQRHVEEVTGLKGDTAVQKCRVDIATSRATLKLEGIHGGRLAGERALIQFTASVGSKRQRQTLRVRKVDGRWLFDGDGSAGL